MKKITEMTEQEIIALTDADVEKIIKLRMMEEGIKIMDKPKKPELFDIEPADQKVYTIPLLPDLAFTDLDEATRISEALKNATSLRATSYDYNKLSSDYKYLEKKDRYSYFYRGSSDYEINTSFVYSPSLYSKIAGYAAQNKVMKEQIEKDIEEYEKNMSEASDIVSEIKKRVTEVRNKYERLDRLVYKFAIDYYPLADNNEDMAIKFMAKAYSLTDEEKAYILDNYKEYLSPKCSEE